jgi:RimJ/RimL family protein N-acetyltransferase
MTSLPQTTQPTLATTRLRLRPFALSDAGDVQRLAGAREVFDTTVNIPHPYPDGAAEAWIATHAEGFASGASVTFAIAPKDAPGIVGAVGLTIARAHARAELGYWLGQPWWGRGLMTEAARAVLRYGFAVLALNRIQATHFVRNPASGRVMQKIGMRYEGRLLQYFKKGEGLEDVETYAALAATWTSEEGS